MKKSFPDRFDFTILGAGFAGLSMTDELLQRGHSVCLIDKAEPGSGSSGAPLVLINPATGRRAKMVHDAKQSVDTVVDLLMRVQNYAGETKIFEHNGVLRPALDKDLAKDFKRSPNKYDWPDKSWVNWLDKDEFSSKYSYFGRHCGGLEVKHGYTINTSLYIQYLKEYLISRGLTSQFNTNATVECDPDDSYNISFPDGRSAKSDHIIYATGSSVINSPVWDFLPFKTTKGQLLDLTFQAPLPLHASISSMGYFAFMTSEPNRLVVGSTYEHSYENLKPDEKGRETLFNKLERTLPGLKNIPHSANIWSGERISTKDHNPVIGEHPLRRRSYLLTGMGSKGMIQGRYLAKQLAGYILDDAKIDANFNLNRFQSF